MKYEENIRTNHRSDSPDVLPHEKNAEQLFQEIMKGLDMDVSTSLADSRRMKYRNRFLCRTFFKGLLSVAVLGLFTFGGTGVLQKPAISSVKAASSSDSSSTRITFHVEALFPVSQVKATLNENEILVNSLGNRSYSVDVTSNGYLLLDVVSISGIHCRQGMSISSIDDQAPVIFSHSHEEDRFLLFAKDIGEAGINYDGVFASTSSSGKIAPSSYDPESGLIVFPYPVEDMYITIPDNNGNELISVLKPGAIS